jgi:SpoVK/Ycf46/Vps4 family AAA+-type ATPase
MRHHITYQHTAYSLVKSTRDVVLSSAPVCHYTGADSGEASWDGSLAMTKHPGRLGPMQVAEEVDFRGLVAATEGYSGADLKIVCRDASMMPMRRLLAQTTDPDEIRALKEAGSLDVRFAAPPHLLAPYFLPRLVSRPVRTLADRGSYLCTYGGCSTLIRTCMVKRTSGLSSSLRHLARLLLLRPCLRPRVEPAPRPPWIHSLEQQDFENAIRKTQPSVSSADIDKFVQWDKAFASV